VHVLPTATTIRVGGGARWAASCSVSSSAAATAPSVPIGVAPPGGITTASRSRRATRQAANGTSTTVRSRISGPPAPTIAAQFSIAHSLAGWGNTIAAPSSPASGAWRIVAIVWFEPYAPIAQIRRAPCAWAYPSHASSVRTLLPP